MYYARFVNGWYAFHVHLIFCLLMSSADNFCKLFRPRVAGLESNDGIREIFFERVNFLKETATNKQRTTNKSMKNTQHTKGFK